MNSRLIALFAVIFALASMPVEAGELPSSDKGVIGVIAVADLSAEARDTLQAIKRGGPFPYQRDGAEFRNYERILPKKPRRYYREYTVKTPGARNRGARRIISGESNEYYYTADHYQSFKRIRE